jgi:hypothetical protein
MTDDFSCMREKSCEFSTRHFPYGQATHSPPMALPVSRLTMNPCANRPCRSPLHTSAIGTVATITDMAIWTAMSFVRPRPF